MIWRFPARLRAWVLMAIVFCVALQSAHALQSAQFQMDFTDARQTPAHWVLTLNPDGSGSFEAEGQARRWRGSRPEMSIARFA